MINNNLIEVGDIIISTPRKENVVFKKGYIIQFIISKKYNDTILDTILIGAPRYIVKIYKCLTTHSGVKHYESYINPYIINTDSGYWDTTIQHAKK